METCSPSLIAITWCVADVAPPRSTVGQAAELPSGQMTVYPTGEHQGLSLTTGQACSVCVPGWYCNRGRLVGRASCLPWLAVPLLWMWGQFRHTTLASGKISGKEDGVREWVEPWDTGSVLRCHSGSMCQGTVRACGWKLKEKTKVLVPPSILPLSPTCFVETGSCSVNQTSLALKAILLP